LDSEEEDEEGEAEEVEVWQGDLGGMSAEEEEALLREAEAEIASLERERREGRGPGGRMVEDAEGEGLALDLDFQVDSPQDPLFATGAEEASSFSGREGEEGRGCAGGRAGRPAHSRGAQEAAAAEGQGRCFPSLSLEGPTRCGLRQPRDWKRRRRQCTTWKTTEPWKPWGRPRRRRRGRRSTGWTRVWRCWMARSTTPCARGSACRGCRSVCWRVRRRRVRGA